MQKMNPAVKAKWLAALRSGEYQQGQHQLRDNGQEGGPRFCCLGVLCDLHSKETGAVWDGESYCNISGELPDPVVGWAGLDASDPIPTHDERGSLVTLNDDAGLTFPEIADVIEASF